MKRTVIKRHPPKEPIERIPLALLRPGEMKKPVEVEHVFRDGRTKINQNCKEGRDLYQQRKRDAWEMAKRICPICKKSLAWLDSTVDHKIPRSLGIDDRPANIQAVHALCNTRKGSTKMGYYGVA